MKEGRKEGSVDYTHHLPPVLLCRTSRGWRMGRWLRPAGSWTKRWIVSWWLWGTCWQTSGSKSRPGRTTPTEMMRSGTERGGRRVVRWNIGHERLNQCNYIKIKKDIKYLNHWGNACVFPPRVNWRVEPSMKLNANVEYNMRLRPFCVIWQHIIGAIL